MNKRNMKFLAPIATLVVGVLLISGCTDLGFWRDRSSRWNHIINEVSLGSFITVRNKIGPNTGSDGYNYDWMEWKSDLCGGLPKWVPDFNLVNSCLRHDAGYGTGKNKLQGNIGVWFQPFPYNGWNRHATDLRFRRDMTRQCQDKPLWEQPGCFLQRDAYWTFVDRNPYEPSVSTLVRNSLSTNSTYYTWVPPATYQ